MAALIHSTLFWGLIIVPAIFFRYHRHRSPALRRQSALAFNFQVAVSVLLTVAAFSNLAISTQEPFLGFVVYMVAYVGVMVAGAVSTIRAWRTGDATCRLRIPLLHVAA